MDDDTKQCPYCAETIKAAAIVCRFCGRDLNTPEAAQLAAITDYVPERSRGGWARFLILFIIVLLACWGFSQFTESGSTGQSASPRTITASRGSFTIPGSAFMDGRDPEANPPLTVMRINVWDSPQMLRPKCQLEHGDRVDLRDASADQNFVLVQAGSCRGWVQSVFLGHAAERPIGDPIWRERRLPV